MPSTCKSLINRSWKFTYGDPSGATEPGYDDSDWYDVGLPHSFGQPYFMEAGFYVGRGVYRRDFVVEHPDKRVALEFQGVFQDAEVYVNGHHVGRHLGGYTAFEMDVSEAVRPGINQLTVRVGNEWNPRLAPRAGEHVFNGGIYRDVSLIVSEKVRFAWYGTAVTTDGNRVEIATELVNDGDTPFEGQLDAVVSLDDVELATVSAHISLEAGEATTHRTQLLLDEVRQWHPATPVLYQLEQRLSNGEQASTTFGFRTVEFTTDGGFFLNGEHYLINGANVHQDHAGWSDAVSHAGIRRDVAMIKECGMNFIRGSHYPHHEQFAAECDRQGLLFWSELHFWGVGGHDAEGYWNASAYPPHEEDRAEFEESCLRALTEMIRVNRNHPSIIVWSVSNEPFFTDAQVMPEAKKLITRLVDLAHQLDPTRPAAVGGAQRGGFDELGDLAGYNGDGAALFHQPPWPSLVSEYGSTIEDRPGVYGPRYTDGVEIEHPWRAGIALWCAFHHGSIITDMSRMGFIDYFRVPLRSYYWYRNKLRGIEPPVWPSEGTARALRLSSDTETIGTDGTDDAHLRVELVDKSGAVISGERTVTIEVLEGGGLFPTGTSIELPVVDGIGAIEFRSHYAGVNVLRASAEGLEPATLTILATGGPEWTGQPRKLPSGPPSLRYRPGSERLLSANRPVFSSGSPAHDVTDYSTEHGWSGGWVRVDLEGAWRLRRIEVRFGEGADVPFAIETDDGAQVAAGLTGGGAARVELDALLAHEVWVRFPAGPAELIEVRVYGH
ncbi:glycoside hydrolase family 2 TIM barrel-domain containing protein [Nonomuraea angiospora]|uniref:Beta-galactosidase n=1 Tax=Nonomuraea angiospora TaxID=46172 RepID=A0ABR9ML10_9ACTN|nr:glycoside hydrolase family 2 TIM barrel-domain containing protein [Nonomuraea angiospora]MBE1593572.1 beta-galactosidase [Nonomuraea angiospora]